MKSLLLLMFLLPLGLLAQQNYPTEKVHIQTEKTNYQAGDTLRFSVFLWAIDDSVASRVLYVELLSPSGFLVGERTLKIENEPISQYFVLDSTAKGTYTIRAYTQYLTGFGNNSFFQKQIQVGTITSEKSVQLAVEGGSLVEGLPSRLLVQTATPNQSGQLKDDLNNVFAAFMSDVNRLAVVPIVPAKNRNYRVELTFAANDVRAFVVGKNKTTGATIQLNAIDSVLSIKTYLQQLDSDSITTTFYNKNDIVFQQKSVARPVQLLKLPIKLLPVGLLRCVLTDNKNQLLAERLWLNAPTESSLSDMARYNVLDYYVAEPLPQNSKNVNAILNFCHLKTFKQNKILAKEQGLLRRGVAMDTKNNILKNTDLVVWAATKGFGIHTIQTDTGGIFEIKNIDNEGLVELKVQTDDNQLVAVRWLPRQLPPIDESQTAAAMLTTTGMDVPIIDGKQLEEVVIKARKDFSKIKTRLGITYAVIDKTIEGSQLMSVAFTSTMQAIQLVYPLLSLKTADNGTEYFEKRGNRANIIVDGFALQEGMIPPVVQNIEKIDIITKQGVATIFIYTKNLINSVGDIKPNKPFEGNAFLRGFDVANK
jgi:hypothetical protein